MIGQTISHYKVTKKLGGGGMGVVFKAEDTRLKRTVALKFIHPHLITDEPLKKRFLREAQLASSLDHPNVCSIYEIDEAPDGRLFFSMAYYKGEPLSERVKRGPLSSREIFQICFAVAQGMSCAHRKGIIHRDIKPGNIIITEEGYIKIVDFGLAKLAAESSRLTKTDTTVGTVRYMSPEQATDKEVDHRTDIWSLGVILYELSTGQTPFRGEIDAAIFYSILHDDPTPVHELNPKIPEACSHIIMRCLEKDAEKRYQSVDDMLNDMTLLAKELGWGSSIAGLTVPVIGRRSHRKPGRRLRIAGVLGAFTVVLSLLAAWWLAHETSIYTTDMRLAVMPLVNKTHPDNNAYVAGVTEVVYDMLDYASRRHESMWVVPNRLVRYAKLRNNADAREAFGVNRIITGDVQRYGNRQRLFLELRDAESMERIHAESVSFDIASPSTLADSLPSGIARLIDIGDDIASELALFIPAKGSAIKYLLDGLGAYQEDNIESALVSFEKIFSEVPEFAYGRNALGLTYWKDYLNTGEESFLEQSISHLKSSIQLEPRLWQPRFNLGELYRNIDEPDSAVFWFQSVLNDDPGNPLASRGLSRVYSKQRRFDEAEQILQKVIDIRPDYFESHRLQAKHFINAGKEDGAFRTIQAALAFAPNDAHSLNILGSIYHDRGEYAQARQLLERAFQLLPQCDTCCNVGLLLYYEKRYKESASYYEYALQYCGEDDYDVWGNWASSTYWVEGEREKSIELFKKAILYAERRLENDAQNPAIIGSLIEYYAMIGDRENAHRMIERAAPFMDEEQILYAIGDAYAIFGDRNAAFRYLGEAVRHGLPVATIEATRELADLVQDPLFQKIIADGNESVQH